MIENKSTGSYYTPSILSDFLVKHIFDNYIQGNHLKILEPSCGDGQFVSSLFNCYELKDNTELSIDLIEISISELEKAKKLIPSKKSISSKIYHQDYLKFFLETENKYSLIIGNPPYIKKENLQEEQIQRSEAIHKKIRDYNSEVISNGRIKNIWPAFVEAAIMSLCESGILCFVIPAEILQVKYAKELRAMISNEFDRVEIFAFNELIFEGIQQDVIAFIGVKGIENVKEHGFSFYQVDVLEDLKEPRFTEKHSNIHRTTLDKWTNFILSDEQLNFIDELKSKYQPIKKYCKKAEVGIVSAANDYFILNDEDLVKNKLKSLKNIVLPILPKGYVVPNTANFSDNDFHLLKEDNKRVNFLHFPDNPKNKLGKKVNTYLDKGEDKKLHERYKMTRRTHWYHVPSVWEAEGLFVKRSHLYPKFFVNEANVLATDSFYRVMMKDGYNIKNLVFSFYNSLTFVLSELEGRYYGGGVLELTPNEFKNLSIPLANNITEEQFNILDQMLRDEEKIETILAYTNSILLDRIDVERLEEIRKKLVNRRLKKDELDKSIAEMIQIKEKKVSKEENFQVAVG
ncbi:MAG: Eco57I restriction-modification methylase domain-containing protein [Bacteroidales bacterium]|nr:Eco57I restriction-modification methylase domain-containing protein [Bacteroidales bacterium]